MSDTELQARAIIAAALIQSKIVDIHGVNLIDPQIATSHSFHRLQAAVDAVMIAIRVRPDAEPAAGAPQSGGAPAVAGE